MQASIGSIALSEGIGCGKLILTSAVISILITAPLGAILMDSTYKKILTLDDDKDNIQNIKYNKIK